jgi:hypothetical protein
MNTPISEPGSSLTLPLRSCLPVLNVCVRADGSETVRRSHGLVVERKEHQPSALTQPALGLESQFVEHNLPEDDVDLNPWEMNYDKGVSR